MRLLRALQAHALSPPRHPRRPLWRQHGARDVQHHPRRQAAAGKRRDLLLRRLQLRRASASYKQFRWPCCSGTLPQVAADYRINMYFRAPQAVYVNLYVPSTLRWNEGGAALSLTQEGQYPYEDHVSFTVTSSQPTELTLHFRIPRMGGGRIDLCQRRAPEGPRRPRTLRRDPSRVEDRRPRRAGIPAEDAARNHRCPAHRDRRARAWTAGAHGRQAAAGRTGAEDHRVNNCSQQNASGSGNGRWTSAGGPVTLLPFTVARQPALHHIRKARLKLKCARSQRRVRTRVLPSFKIFCRLALLCAPSHLLLRRFAITFPAHLSRNRFVYCLPGDGL